jgi:hypothetical protein
MGILFMDVNVIMDAVEMQTMTRETKEGVFSSSRLLEIELWRMMFIHFWKYMELLLDCRMRVRVLGITAWRGRVKGQDPEGYLPIDSWKRRKKIVAVEVLEMLTLMLREMSMQKWMT